MIKNRHKGTKGWNRLAAMLIILITPMASALKQDINSFNSGELAPKFQRGDHQKYYGGCRTLENFTVLALGGAERRPGMKFIAEIPFDLFGRGDCTDLAHTIPISNLVELQAMNDELDGNFYLTNDIDASDTKTDTDTYPKGFTPIGFNTFTKFTGTLDGQGFTISGLYILDNGFTNGVGLFGAITDGTICNFNLIDCEIDVISGVTGMVAANVRGTSLIQGVIASGTIDNLRSQSGGFVGQQTSGVGDIQIKNCAIDVAISRATAQSDVGLFAGNMNKTDFTDCYATGSITAPTAFNVGGFIGITGSDVAFLRCFVDGVIPGQTFADARTNGGFLGSNVSPINATFTDCSYLSTMNELPFGGEDEVQVNTASHGGGGNQTGGTWTFTFDSITTGTIAFNASQSECQTAFDAAFGEGVIEAQGGTPAAGSSTQSLYYREQYSRTDVALATADASNLTGPASPYTFTITLISESQYPTLTTGDPPASATSISSPVRTNPAVRLIPFVHSADAAYVVEFGNQYNRFYRDAAQILDEGEPYEIATPYDTDDLFQIKFIQSANWMYLTHPDHIPQKLIRTSDTSWTMEDVELERGPFLLPNKTDIEITPTEIGGGGIDAGASVTLAASSAVWNANHVGAHWQITHTVEADSVSGGLSGNGSSSAITIQLSRTFDFSTHGTWTGTMTLQRSFDGSIWKDVLPIHYENDGNVTYTDIEQVADATYRVTMSDYTEGTANFNLTARSFDLNGVVEITAFSSSTSVTATVENELGAATATKVWAEGAFSDDEGWPACLAFYEERLVFAATTNNPQTMWFSQTDDWENFKEGDLADEALIYTIAADQVNAIRWMSPQNSLLLGTISAEWQFGASGENEALTPTTRPRAARQSSYGSSDLQGIMTNNVVLFAQAGRKIRELTYSFEIDSWVAPDMTVLSEHITESGIVEMDFQKVPHPILWCIRADGQIAAMTYMREENVVGWNRATTWTSNMTVESNVGSVAVIPGTLEDEVWFAVERVIDGNTVRYVEQMQPFDWGNDPNDMWFVDCGLSFTGGSQPSGLGHLEGETVAILADGITQDTQVVTNGALPAEVTYTGTLTVGLPYNSKLLTMKLELPGSITLTGATKRITDVVLRLHKTLQMKVGPSWTEFDLMPFEYDEDGNERDPNVLFSGDLSIDFDGGHEVGGNIYIQHDDPTAATILKMVTEFESY